MGEPGAEAAGGRWFDAVRVLEARLWARGYTGYDPHDLLASPLVRRLTFGSRWLGVAWTQLGKRSPVQLRPLLRVPRTRNPKALALCLASDVRLWDVTGEAAWRERAVELIGLLAASRVSAGGGAGWGYPFPWANRSFEAPAATPSGVVTAFVGHALLDAAEALGDGSAAGMAGDAGAFMLGALQRVRGTDGTFAFSYTPLDRRVVHNANVLCASLLARLAARGLGPGGAADEALAAARYTVAAQRPDGSWPYGESARDGWVDSFHTGYALVALRGTGRALGTDELEPAVAAGLDYWRRTFLVGPAVRFHAGHAYPIDLHAVAHAILTLLDFRDELPDGLETAERLGAWSVERMRAPGGYFYYRKGRFLRNRLEYTRWVQAWMLRALTALAQARSTSAAAPESGAAVAGEAR